VLVRKYRITKDKEYKNVFSGSISVFSRFLILRAVKNDLDLTRFGFIVSLKVSKKAHQRIKIKRWLRESAKIILDNDSSKAIDIVVIAKKGAFEAGYHKLNEELESSFKKALKIYEKNCDFNNKNLSKNNISRS